MCPEAVINRQAKRLTEGRTCREKKKGEATDTRQIRDVTDSDINALEERQA